MEQKSVIQDSINSKEITPILKILLEELVTNLDELDNLIDEDKKGSLSAGLKIPTKCRIIKGINKNILNEKLDETLYGAIVSLNALCTMMELDFYNSSIKENLENTNEKSHNKSKSLHL